MLVVFTLKKEFVEKFVGVTPDEYDQLEDRHKKVLEIFSRYSFDKILDVGCGDGNFSTLLKKTGHAKEVYGVEVSTKGVEFAKENGVNAFQIDMDTEDFPFQDNSFNAVFAGEIIEHLFDTDYFLDEVYRVLSPKGIFVLSTPNLASIHNRVALLFGFQPFPMGISARFNFLGRVYEPNTNPSLDHSRVGRVSMS